MRSLVLAMLPGLATAAGPRPVSCDQDHISNVVPFWTPYPDMSPRLNDFGDLWVAFRDSHIPDMQNVNEAVQLTGKQFLYYHSGTAYIDLSLDDPNKRQLGQIVNKPNVWIGAWDVEQLINVGTRSLDGWKPPPHQYWQGTNMQIMCDTVNGGPRTLVYARVKHA